jgi:hypothetical protein
MRRLRHSCEEQGSMIWVVVGFGEELRETKREDFEAAEGFKKMIEPFQAHIITDEGDNARINVMVYQATGIMPRL